MPLDDSVTEQGSSGRMRARTSFRLKFSSKLFGRDLHVGWLLILSAVTVNIVVDHFDKNL